MSDIKIFACDDSACIFQVNDAALDPRPFYVLSADYSALKEDFDDALGREAALREEMAADCVAHDAETDLLQQRLTVAEHQAGDAIELLEVWRTWLGFNRESCDDGGKRIWDRIDVVVALKPAEEAAGSTCNQIREESGLPTKNPCVACNNGACIDR